MQPLTEDFIQQCPIEKGFRMRGMAMTRIEVFVDAAFAFAVTMLVISIDQIPTSIDELRILFQYFAAGFFILALIFMALYRHALNLKTTLKLSVYEVFQTTTEIIMRWILIVVCLLAFILPALVPDKWVPFTGFTYALLGPANFLLYSKREKFWHQKNLEISAN